MRGERVDERIEAARSGLERPRGVDRDAIETGRAELAGDGCDLLGLGPEPLGSGVVAARRRRRLALEAQRSGVASGVFGVALDRGGVTPRLIEVRGRARRQPTVPHLTRAPQRRRSRAADPDRKLAT